MMNPVYTTLSLPRTFGIATVCTTLMGSAVAARLIEEQTRLLLSHSAHRRAGDNHKHPEHVATGADWKDHYGSRHTDVDVERV